MRTFWGCCNREQRAFSAGYDQGVRDAYERMGQPPVYDEVLKEKAEKEAKQKRTMWNLARFSAMSAGGTAAA